MPRSTVAPQRWAHWLDNAPRLRAWLAPRLDRGRRLQVHTLRGHLQLRAAAGLRRWRRGKICPLRLSPSKRQHKHQDTANHRAE